MRIMSIYSSQDISIRIIYLLLKCKIISRIWSETLKYIAENTELSITFSDQEKLLGIQQSSFKDVFNLIFIIVKQYLYACRCANKMPIFPILMKKIEDIKLVEFNIAVKNDRVSEYQKKWGIFLLNSNNNKEWQSLPWY